MTVTISIGSQSVLLWALLACLVAASAEAHGDDDPSSAAAAPEDPPPPPPPPELADAAIANAEALLGEPYRWGGRMTTGNPGIDCLGLLYLAYGPPTETPWRRYPVDPSKIVRSEMLGTPVPGAAGVLREDLDVGTLKRGDVLYLLMEEYEIEDEPLLVTESARYWPWHTALYVGGEDHAVIHAAPGGVVRKQPLETMQFDGLFVTRLGTHATPSR